MKVEGPLVNGAECVLRTLRAMGVERIYASPGSDWAPLWEALAHPYGPDEVPEYISVRHEETAISMANAYSKVTGKLPAVVLHTTVGALHGAMAMRIAMHERVPMVVLAGESINFAEPPAPMVGRQWLRLLTDTGGPARLVEPVVKWSFALNTPHLLAQTLQRACQLAMSAPRGPVFVSVPLEHLLEKLPNAVPQPMSVPRPGAPEAGALDEIARALSAARSPLIITEEAGRDPAAVRSLVALAEALGAPVAEGWQAYYVNFPRNHPLYAGVQPDMAPLVDESDVVLLADCVAPWHPPSSLPKAGTKVFALGEDPLRSRLPFWGFRTDLVAPGELRAALDGLSQRVSPKGKSRRIRQDVLPVSPAMNNAWIAQALNEALPENAAVVNETITHRGELLKRLTRLGPGGYFETSFGGLGVGLSAALGVKHAQPERTVIATVGDGGFHYNPVLAAFGASQELDLPILVLLFDNGGYLSQKTDVLNYYPQGAAAKSGRFAGTSITPRPDYAKLAEAYGGSGEKVESADRVAAALKRGLEAVRGGKLALVHLVLA